MCRLVFLDIARSRPSSPCELEVKSSGGKLSTTPDSRCGISFGDNGCDAVFGFPSFFRVAFPSGLPPFVASVPVFVSVVLICCVVCSLSLYFSCIGSVIYLRFHVDRQNRFRTYLELEVPPTSFFESLFTEPTECTFCGFWYPML